MKNKLLIFAVILIMIGFISGCGSHAESALIHQKANMLSDFENIKIWDISPEHGFDLSLSTEQVSEGSHSLKVVYPIDSYPSINTRKLNHNWGDYGYFCFDVFNPQNKKINFTVRLDDAKRKKINISYPLEHGWNYVRIPKSKIGGRINANKISFVVLFLNKPKEKIILYFDNMRLENAVPETSEKMRTNEKLVSVEKRAFIAQEAFEPMQVENPLPVKGEMKAYVTKLANPKKTEVLVSSGVPFAPGQLDSERNFAVFDINGNEIPIAVKALARWPQDNSIRSLLVQFPMEIPHKYKQVSIRWGIPRTTQDLIPATVDWILPEGFMMLPVGWLCKTEIIGEQIPFGQTYFPVYDSNIDKYYPKISKTPWTGDISKDGYYSTPHVFYQLYIRTGEDKYFESARRELVHYRDEIIQEGPHRGKHKTQKKTRYIYVEAMVDDYLLTGDPKSLEVAGYMAEYLKKNYSPSNAYYPKNSERFWTERETAFPLLGIITYYELTGNKEYLDAAQQIVQNLYKTQAEWPGRGGFIHNLYAHDTSEGARRDEYGGSPFMTGLLLEGIIEYHRLTGSNIAKDSIFRALDWLMNEGLAPEGKSFVYLTCDKYRDEGHPDLNMLIVHAFGYGYKISGYTRKDYLDVGNKVFEEGVKHGYLKGRKHFNQNYRSSGHYLAYISGAGR